MKIVHVLYQGWGENWPLGTLADDGQQLLFEYSPQALAEGLSLSPRYLPLQKQAIGHFPPHQWRLPGLFADSLPDGWGMLLMDKLFRKQGIRLEQFSPLDRLSFIGHRGMGALTYEPDTQGDVLADTVDLVALAQETVLVLQGADTETLQRLALLGGSPQGARPKVLVFYDPASARISTTPMHAGSGWLVKFQAMGEHKEVCAIEAFYAQLSRACGLDVPDTHVFDLSAKQAALGIERFDLVQGQRVPIHSLAGFLHADFRIPSAVDYTTFLRATRMLTRDEREVQKAFERAVFNVLFHNRDDHPKNLAFRMDAQRHWKLAPCFDLTYSQGPGGEHQMDVCGEGLNIQRSHLMQLAQNGGLDQRWALQRLDGMLDVVDQWRELVSGFDIRQRTAQAILQSVQKQQSRLA
ncbi:type II toxin-antitoxin system HipA family toxin [Limnohabitans sp. 2KL-51]|uniref:type II toxin-antitoxin system HipA family toxin n=1 Tax=Limnohabitans sp. 2KL-51 TaxID=1977911 RepID=UPI000D368B89|nr:type II toxin-antitoxin system HipA family toxin [Limnohabitans sp. 2KL-51]PUE44503.1 phosphatidylinositol kinase [Limnohabitans sp. 2KL-51]